MVPQGGGIPRDHVVEHLPVLFTVAPAFHLILEAVGLHVDGAGQQSHAGREDLRVGPCAPTPGQEVVGPGFLAAQLPRLAERGVEEALKLLFVLFVPSSQRSRRKAQLTNGEYSALI